MKKTLKTLSENPDTNGKILYDYTCIKYLEEVST